MRAIVFTGAGEPLVERDVPRPEPAPGHVRLAVGACGVCRTDLHILDGELSPPKLPLVLGHQIVGTVTKSGEGATRFAAGSGSAFHGSPGRAAVAVTARAAARTSVTGRGSPATTSTAASPRRWSPTSDSAFRCRTASRTRRRHLSSAPGLIGYRAYGIAGDAERIGFYGFGAAAHILCQVARWEGRRIFAFTKPGDTEGQAFARSLGAEWAGGPDERPPEELDAAIIFAPAGALVPAALAACAKGGSVVCAGIHMSNIPDSPTSCSGASGSCAR